MSQFTILHRSQMFAAATALSTAGFLTAAPPAQAHPILPFPQTPACSQWGFPGNVSIFQSGHPNGTTVTFNSTGPVAKGVAKATQNSSGEEMFGDISGGITGDKVDFTINWRGKGIGHYTGVVTTTALPSGQVPGDAYGNTVDETNPSSTAGWFTTMELTCITPGTSAIPAAPPPPAAPPAAPAAATAARLGVTATGPATLKAGMTDTYTVTVSNPGDLSAPVELFISFNGNLRQTGQPAPTGGFNCTVNNYAGGTSSVHCTVGQFGSKATASITVQGLGSAPGAGQLVANINSSDPGAQFVQKSQQLNVAIA